MEIKKKDGNVILSKLKSDELFAFLKMQIPAQIIFVNSLGNQAKQYFDLIDRLYINSEKIIEGDIFISVDRVTENAEKFKAPFENELVRVLSHGVLHLTGYKDKSPEDAAKMREAEESAIQEYLTL